MAEKVADGSVNALFESVMQVRTFSRQKCGAEKTMLSYALSRLGQAENRDESGYESGDKCGP